MRSSEERVKNIMRKVKDYKKQRGEVLTEAALCLCAVLGLFVYAKVGFEDNILDFNISGDKNIINNNEYAALEEIKLPTFNSKQEILEKVKVNTDDQDLQSDYIIMEDASISLKGDAIFNGLNAPTTDSVATAPTGANKNELLDNVTDSHSTTNVQVQGVGCFLPRRR